ncbi:hypothetical protein HJJEPNFP_00015 [Ralstonia phage BOESR1]|uniref:Uncharacterized protein n=1 Tax=Ralstonia phage BOESR1 TaxID=3034917 RepID=A0AA50F2T5_9CAUD|nr:hypothetical protein HJJEPNFP_00015 [Ralstonia phage BOESR1]WLW40593.1 hypothetical protein HIBIKMCM_00026 [Ralstonia phage BOESR1]
MSLRMNWKTEATACGPRVNPWRKRMTSILILLVLNMGTINGVYLGEFDSPAACQQALPRAAQALKNNPALKSVEGAALICVPKREA